MARKTNQIKIKLILDPECKSISSGWALAILTKLMRTELVYVVFLDLC